MKHIKIGLFGFGCVGQGLYEIINSSDNFNGEISKICIKDPTKHRTVSKHLLTTNKDDLLLDPDIDVIVELIDDAIVAKSIVTQALRQGKSVVTANKKMVAEHLEELVALQHETGQPLLYEGAVCGSIPIIRTLEEYYGHEPLNEIKGIFNGSTNYILTKIFEERSPYQQALKKAQNLGFAESDPRLDVEGLDAKYKLSILLLHGFGLFVKPDQIINFGIDRISNNDLAFARQQGLEIKLFGTATKVGNKIFGFVIPQFVKPQDPLSQVKQEYNAVSIQGAFCGEQRLIGKGAGSHPTGAAVLSDISALRYDYRYEFKKAHLAQNTQFSNDSLIEAYVSFNCPDAIDLTIFESISERYFSFDHSYVIGEICLNEILNSNWRNNADINIVLTDKAPSEMLGKLSVEKLYDEVKELKKGKKVLEKISI